MKDLLPGSATSRQLPVVSCLWEYLNWSFVLSKVTVPSRRGFHVMTVGMGTKAHDPLNSTSDNSKKHLSSRALHEAGWGLHYRASPSTQSCSLPLPSTSCWCQEHFFYKNVPHVSLHMSLQGVNGNKIISDTHSFIWALYLFFQMASHRIARILVFTYLEPKSQFLWKYKRKMKNIKWIKN